MSVLLAVLPLISIGSTDDSELEDSLRSIAVDAAADAVAAFNAEFRVVIILLCFCFLRILVFVLIL